MQMNSSTLLHAIQNHRKKGRVHLKCFRMPDTRTTQQFEGKTRWRKWQTDRLREICSFRRLLGVALGIPCVSSSCLECISSQWHKPPSLLIALVFLLSGRVTWGNNSNHQHSSSSYTSSSCRDTPGPNFPSAKHEIKRECHTTSTLMRGHFASSPTHTSTHAHLRADTDVCARTCLTSE